MIIKTWTDNNANIHSKRKEEVDTEDLGYSEEEWKKFTDDEKDGVIRGFWLENEAFQYGWEE